MDGEGQVKIYTIHVKKSGLPIVFINTPSALKLDSKAEILGLPKHKRGALLANKG